METKLLNIVELKPPMNTTLVTSNTGLAEVRDYLGSVEEFGFDTETNFVDSIFDRKIRTIQLGDRNKQYVIDLLAFAGSTEALKEQGNKTAPLWAKELVKTLEIGLDSPSHLKLGVNLQFDYEVLRWCLGIRSYNFYDCNLAEKVLYCGKVRFDSKTFWGMDNMVERYCKLTIDKTLQQSFDLETPLTQAQIDYAALDVRLPFSIRAGQQPKLEKDGLVHTAYAVEFNAIPAFGDMRLAGILLSKEKWMKQNDKVKEQYLGYIEQLDKVFLPVVGSKHRPLVDLLPLENAWKSEDNKELRAEKRKKFYEARKLNTTTQKEFNTYEGEAAINYASKPQLLNALKKAGINLKNTNNKSLKLIANKYEVIKVIQKYRSAEKLLSTYGEKFVEDNINEFTGRVHSNINQLGADTGRTSSSSPNIQNLPKEADYRSCFVARPGYVIITRDYDGCELRLIAELSGEESWINAFNSNKDVHSMCAELMYGDEWKNAAEPDCRYYSDGEKCNCKGHKKLRNSVKSINFGLAYGAMAANIAEQIGILKQAAQKLIDTHKERFPKVHAMLDGVGTSSKNNLCVRTIGGRIRYFHKPTWQRAKEITIEHFEEDKRPLDEMTTGHIQRVYNTLYNSIEREGKNTPFQGSNADMAKVAMGIEYIWKHLEPKYGAFFVNMVHDELVIECPKENAEECSKFVGECMERAGELYVKSMKMTSGGVIADHWTKD